MRVLILPSAYPKDANDLNGASIVPYVSAFSQQFETKIVDCTRRSRLMPQAWWIRLQTRKIMNKLKAWKWKPDIIHAHGTFPAGVIALALKEELKIPCVLTEHTSDVKEHMPHYLLYDAVVGASRFHKETLEKQIPKLRVDVVGNIISQDFFSTPLPSDSHVKRIAYIGELTERSGGSELIKALETLDRRKSQIEVLLTGTGSLKKSLQKKSAQFNSISLSWIASGTPLKDVLFHTDLVLLPNKAETFSDVAAKALAMGRPIIGFKCGGPEDYVGRGDGVLLNKRDPNALAAQVLEGVPGDPEERRKKIHQRYSPQAVTRQYSALFKRILNENRPG